MKKLALALAAAAALSAPLISHAESDSVAPAAAGVAATARLNFQITIPRILYLRVGSGASFSDVGTIDLIHFDFTATGGSVGSGTAVAANAASGDLGNGGVTVRMFGNSGNATLNSNVTGPMNSGVAVESVPWSQISVASAALPAASATAGFNNSALAHPAFSATTGAGTPVPLTAVNRLVREEARWTYTYLNANLLADGVYGGTAGKNGIVSYTLTSP